MSAAPAAPPPPAVVMQMMTGAWTAQTISAVTCLRVPELVHAARAFNPSTVTAVMANTVPGNRG